MKRPTIDEIAERQLGEMGADERAEYDEGREAVELAFQIGDAIRGLRETAGLSQRALALRMHTSQAQVARIEAGVVAATLTTLQRAARALGFVLNVDFIKRPQVRSPARVD